jgi:hypothetical protein
VPSPASLAPFHSHTLKPGEEKGVKFGTRGGPHRQPSGVQARGVQRTQVYGAADTGHPRLVRLSAFVVFRALPFLAHLPPLSGLVLFSF